MCAVPFLNTAPDAWCQRTAWCQPHPLAPPTLPLPACQVDELYNHRTRLVCSAAAPPDQLFVGADHSEPIIDLEQLQVRVWLVLEPG